MLLRRLVALNMAVLILLFSCMVFYNIRATDELVKNEIYGTFENAMDNGADDISQVFDQARVLTLEVCVFGSIQEVMGQPFSTEKEAASILIDAGKMCRDVVHLVPYCSADILLMNEDGQLLGPTDTPGKVTNVSESFPEWSKALLSSAGGFLWDYGSNDYGSYIRVSRLIYNEKNWDQALGAVSVRINSDYLRTLLTSIWLGRSGKAYLLDDQGTLLFPYWGGQSVPASLRSQKGGTFLEEDDGSLLISREISPSGFWVVGIAKDVDTLEQMSNQRKTILLFAVLLLGIATALTFLVAYHISHPIMQLASAMKQVEEGDFSVTLEPPRGKGEIPTLYRNFNSMLRMRESLIEEIYGAKLREKETELLALQAQINPHFLYNTLDSINWMAVKYDAEDIEEAVTDLARMLRYSLNNGENILTVSEELNQIQSYIKLQRMRFSDSFVVQYDVDPEVLDCMMIKLMLQPLVENSLLHGFDNIDYVGTLIIRIKRQGEQILFEVINDGNLIDLEKIHQALYPVVDKKPTSYGLRNVNNRLEKYYGPGCCLHFSINGIYSIASFTIPVQKRRKQNGTETVPGPDRG